MTPIIRPIRLDLDANDVFFLLGAAMAFAGGALISFRWTLVIAGVALAAIGLTGIGGRKS